MNDKHNNKSNMITIITNAVCGRATQPCQTTIFVPSKNNVEPEQVLGCTITNAEICGSKFENYSNNNINIRIDGKFEIHAWYEIKGDTAVSKSTEKFSEVISIESFEGVISHKGDFRNKSILAWINQNPIVLGTMIVNKGGIPTIAIQVEYELGVEVVGEAKMNILSYGSNNIESEIVLDSSTEYGYEFDDINYDDVD